MITASLETHNTNLTLFLVDLLKNIVIQNQLITFLCSFRVCKKIPKIINSPNRLKFLTCNIWLHIKTI